MGARRRNLRLARGSADSVCLRAHCYLHHGLPRPHTRPRTLATPLQPHFTPTSSPPTPLHPIAISILAINYLSGSHTWACPNVGKDIATLNIHSTHSINTRTHPTPTRLGKVFKRALVVPPSSLHKRAFVCGVCIGTAQVGLLLVSLF